VAAVAAFALAFASVLATTVLIDRPDARQRMHDLWAAAPLRYLEPPAVGPAGPVEVARGGVGGDTQPPRTETLDSTVTGSIAARAGQEGASRGASPEALLGVDLGVKPSLAEARRTWLEVRPRLDPGRYRAVVAVEDGAPGPLLRLIVGPIERADEVAWLCGQLAAVAPGCRPALFDGQSLPALEPAR
jgi:hypothetical protein